MTTEFKLTREASIKHASRGLRTQLSTVECEGAWQGELPALLALSFSPPTLLTSLLLALWLRIFGCEWNVLSTWCQNSAQLNGRRGTGCTHSHTYTHTYTHAHHTRHTLALQTNKHWRNFAAISKSFFFSNFYFCFFFSLSSQAFAAAAVAADADGDVVICICNQKVAHKLCFMLIFERTHTHAHAHKELDDRHFNVPRPAPSHTWNRKNEHRMQRIAHCAQVASIFQYQKGGEGGLGRVRCQQRWVGKTGKDSLCAETNTHIYTCTQIYAYLCECVRVWPCLVLPLWIAEIANCAASLVHI